MTDNIENSVIEHLKALRGELKEFRFKHDADMADIKHRLTALERGMGAVKRDASDYYESQVGQQITIDRLSERLDRIERRLELT
jgi:tetrahydromethanopterin S-methyltransferase subunit G